MYVCIYSATRNTIRLDSRNPKMLILNVSFWPNILSLSIFFLSLETPPLSRFVGCRENITNVDDLSATRGCRGKRLWGSSADSTWKSSQIGQWISNKPSVASACIHTYIPSFSFLPFAVPFSTGAQSYNNAPLSSVPCVSPPGPIFVFL